MRGCRPVVVTLGVAVVLTGLLAGCGSGSGLSTLPTFSASASASSLSASASPTAPTSAATSASSPATRGATSAPSASGSPSLTTTATATGARSPSPTATGTSALTALGRLSVAKNEAAAGYTRSLFGEGWLDPDGNGCDAREDVLRRDLSAVVLRSTSPCKVVDRGTLRDPYTGATLAFVRGPSTSGQVQIDHVVSLSNAWRTGAQHWTQARREAFANDPLNLLATTEAVNMDKANDDAAQWLPPLAAARCAFAARQVAVKTKYAMTVRQAERDALAAVLAGCPAEPLPA